MRDPTEAPGGPVEPSQSGALRAGVPLYQGVGDRIRRGDGGDALIREILHAHRPETDLLMPSGTKVSPIPSSDGCASYGLAIVYAPECARPIRPPEDEDVRRRAQAANPPRTPLPNAPARPEHKHCEGRPGLPARRAGWSRLPPSDDSRTLVLRPCGLGAFRGDQAGGWSPLAEWEDHEDLFSMILATAAPDQSVPCVYRQVDCLPHYGEPRPSHRVEVEFRRSA
jgi:hypothetical protein